ncbi:MAG: nicotinamide riboside transporter PnuC, partial [Bacteroidota bacterium]
DVKNKKVYVSIDYYNFCTKSNKIYLLSEMNDVLDYLIGLELLEASGLVFGLLAVYFLIKENILTWPAGIAYVLVSFVIFGKEKLYGDFALHVVFLILNIYGWWFWAKDARKADPEVPISTYPLNIKLALWIVSIAGIFITGLLLSKSDASLPYWDSATTVLSLTGMWLTARKKIENWHFWLVVDVLATGIYFYKGIYFYALLYLIYIGMAIAGFRAWKKTMDSQNT